MSELLDGGKRREYEQASQQAFLQYLEKGQTDSAWNIYEPGEDHPWIAERQEEIRKAAKKGIVFLLYQPVQSEEIIKTIKSLITYYAPPREWIEQELQEADQIWEGKLSEKLSEYFEE